MPSWGKLPAVGVAGGLLVIWFMMGSARTAPSPSPAPDSVTIALPSPPARTTLLPVETSVSDEGVGPESLAAPVLTRPPGPANVALTVDQAPSFGEIDLPAPTLHPSDPGWVATRLQVPALGIDVAVQEAANAGQEDFPPHGGAYILRSSSQPARGTNSYIFAHAMPGLFKPLWHASAGMQVVVTMSDGQRLGYRITAVHRNIPCPDPTAPKPAGLPPVLANATECDTSWTLPTRSERLTMQTSQGFNRNWGEMMVIAEPAW